MGGRRCLLGSVSAQDERVLELTSQHVAFQVLRMQIGLCAIRAREFAIRILLRNSVTFW